MELPSYHPTGQPETGEELVAFLLLRLPQRYSSVLASEFSDLAIDCEVLQSGEAN